MRLKTDVDRKPIREKMLIIEIAAGIILACVALAFLPFILVAAGILALTALEVMYPGEALVSTVMVAVWILIFAAFYLVLGDSLGSGPK
jgi:hypothetical protein